MDKRVEITVFKFKYPEVEVKCAQHIIENTNLPFKLVIWDTREEKNEQAKFFNRAIKNATCDYVAFVDSDAFVPPGWLEKMLPVLDDPKVAVVIPASNIGTPIQKETTNKGVIQIPDGTPCVWLSRKGIFDEIGFLDEEFGIYGCDTEWFARANRMGYKCMLQSDVFVHHIGGYSVKKEVELGNIDLEAEKEKSSKLRREKGL